MDIGTALTLGFLWLLFSLISGKKKYREGQRPKASQRRPASETTGRAQLPPPLPPPSAGRVAHADPTQREGFRLESLLKELARTLDQSSGPLGRAPDTRLPSAEVSEEGTSLETPARVVTRDLPVTPEERLPVDQDDEAEQVVARRIAAAEARSGPLTVADHLTFDARIRQEPADHTATVGFSSQRLRQAVIWREILGPPLGLRDSTGRGNEG
jgi:hypothetical protein